MGKSGIEVWNRYFRFRGKCRGRVNSSNLLMDNYINIPEDDTKLLEECHVETFKASGKGGQHINSTNSAVRISHIPTNTIATCQDERSQYVNKKKCLSLLRKKLKKKNYKKTKKKLSIKIKKIIKSGCNIAGYGATSKSTTILNYCNINHKYIDFISDTTIEKINKYTPGTHIPIVPIEYFRNNIPNYTFLFAWNHKKEIFKKEKKILNKTNWFAHVKI